MCLLLQVLWYHHYQKNGSWEDEKGNYYVRVVQVLQHSVDSRVSGTIKLCSRLRWILCWNHFQCTGVQYILC